MAGSSMSVTEGIWVSVVTTHMPHIVIYVFVQKGVQLKTEPAGEGVRAFLHRCRS